MKSYRFRSVNLAACDQWSHTGSQTHALAKICNLLNRKSKGKMKMENWFKQSDMFEAKENDLNR